MQFFAHYAKGGCGGAEETEEHRSAKIAVYQGCSDAGWNAQIEAIGPSNGWRADVLATLSEEKVAFEIQWSKQSEERTRERQAGLARDGVSCFWLFRNVPLRAADPSLPAFQLGDDSRTVVLESGAIGLREFVGIVLMRRIRFCDYLTHQTIGMLRLRHVSCPRCARTVHVGEQVRPAIISVCGREIAPALSRVLRREELEATEWEAIDPQFVLRRSPVEKPFMEALRLAGFCPHCEQLLDLSGGVADLPIDFEHKERSKMHYNMRHWCVDIGNGFCSGLR